LAVVADGFEDLVGGLGPDIWAWVVVPGVDPGEYFRRRALSQVQAVGYGIEQVQRFNLGLVERLIARKPGPTSLS
jgi:hypothetical protein